MGSEVYLITQTQPVSENNQNTQGSQIISESVQQKAKSSGFSNFFGDVWQGVWKGDFSDRTSTASTVGQIGAGLTPVYGQICDLRDTAAAVNNLWHGKDGAWSNMGIALIAWVPLFGDVAKSAFKGVGRIAGDTLSKANSLVSRTARETSQFAVNKKPWFYKPTVDYKASLPGGTGATDAFGNVTLSANGSRVDRALAYHHEAVHSALSPKFNILREFRADVAMTAYQRSDLLRYTEEALAESYAQLKVNGLKGLAEGLSFPITNGYVELSQMAKEGAIGTIAVGGMAYFVSVRATKGE